MPVSAENVRSLQPYDIRVLMAVERLMRRYRWVPLDVLRHSTGLSESEVRYRLGRLMAMDMVKSSTVPYEGYQMIFAGYDTLALHTLTRRGTIRALGPLIGEGKEAVVYEALGFGPVVLKFHRVGQRSFQTARRSRGYMPDGGHFPWLFASTSSAKREFGALERLVDEIRVPVPLDQNRNVVVMSLIEGTTINRCTLPDPAASFEQVLGFVEAAFRLGVIHGDLSEFNIMFDGEECWVIDWPQWVEADHPNGEEILARDIANVLTHFEKKYGLSCSLEDAMARVVG
ncbi:MAG: serine/threonine protein phosphatase [Methanomicrobiaceae archaeon]|nr:serine/threonine protein phosphatase [Methanomicrobiaceae archaeon]